LPGEEKVSGTVYDGGSIKHALGPKIAVVEGLVAAEKARDKAGGVVSKKPFSETQR
jgi:hypothetical protein